MAAMCEECKCTIYLEAQPDGSKEFGGCENNCPCCNDSQYKSDANKIAELNTLMNETLNKLRSAVILLSDPFDDDSLQYAIGEVELALQLLEEGAK